MNAPRCKVCNENHYNFQSCDAAKASKARPNPTVFRKREGWSEFGDRLDTVDVVGNTYWLKERPKRWQRNDP